MKLASIGKVLPYLLLFASGAVGLPTLIAAFSGEPTNGVYAGLSSTFLVLALVCLPYSQRSGSGTEPKSIR